MTSNLHPWVRCLTRPDGLQLIRHHIAASHNKLHSSQACPTSSDLFGLLILYPWHTQSLLQNQPDDIIQCLAKRLLQGGVNLELLLELQTGQFDTLLVNSVLGADASIREAYVATLSGAVSTFPTAFLSSQTPVEFRIALCRHLFSIQQPISELAPVIGSILKSSSNCQALVLDLLRYFGNNADLLYSFISNDSSCFSSHFLESIIESAQCVSVRLFELVISDNNLQPIFLDPDVLFKYKITSPFISSLSLALKATWGSAQFCFTTDQCRLLLRLRQKLIIEEDVLTAIFKSHAHDLPTPIRSDVVRFCILSGLSSHKQLFISIFDASTVEDFGVIGSTLSNLITYQQIFPVDILEDALSSFDEFMPRRNLAESLLGSSQFVNACIRNLKALQFLCAITEQHRGLTSSELTFPAIITSLRLISEGCPYSSYLHSFIVLIWNAQHNINDVIQVILDLNPVVSDACDILVDCMLFLISDFSHIANVYERIRRYDSRKCPFILRLILKILKIGHLPPPNTALIRMWITSPHTTEDELIIMNILNEYFNVNEDVIDLIPYVTMRCLTSQDENIRANYICLISRYKHEPHRNSTLSFINWRIKELEQSKWIGCCNPEDAKALVILKDIASRLYHDNASVNQVIEH